MTGCKSDRVRKPTKKVTSLHAQTHLRPPKTKSSSSKKGKKRARESSTDGSDGSDSLSEAYPCTKKGKHRRKGKRTHHQSPRCTDSNIESPKDVAEVVTMSRATSVVGQLENTEMEENEDRVDEEGESEVHTLSIDGDPNDADVSPKGCHGGTIRKCYLEEKTSR